MVVSVIARAWAVGLLIACGAPPAPRAPSPPSAPPRASVRVAAEACIARPTVEARLLEVLAAHRAMDSGLAIEVRAAPSEATTALALRAVRSNGEVGLARDFTLAPADCASATQLLALSLDRWLSAFPEWADPPLPPPPPPPPPVRWTEVALAGAVNTIWVPVGVDAQVEALVDHGPRRDRFGVTLVVRASVPQGAGRGHFQQTSLLAGASWRHAVDRWELRVEARGGAVLVSGFGFAENDSDWLPWWEAAVFGGRRFGWGTLGLEVAGTALRHRAVTRDGLVSEDIPLLRLGLAGVFGLRSRSP